jgi:hypothetical protein
MTDLLFDIVSEYEHEITDALPGYDSRNSRHVNIVRDKLGVICARIYHDALRQAEEICDAKGAKFLFEAGQAKSHAVDMALSNKAIGSDICASEIRKQRSIYALALEINSRPDIFKRKDEDGELR